jgi:hypothetical protein
LDARRVHEEVFAWRISNIGKAASGTNSLGRHGILASVRPVTDRQGPSKGRKRARMAVTLLVDSNHNDRTIPAVGDRVRVKAREGVFVVLRVNEKADVADILSCESGLRPVDTGVPLSLLSSAYDYLPELFRWYVEKAPSHHADGTDG